MKLDYEKLENLEMENIPPEGTTIIDHKKRVDLKLSCNDYCILDIIARRRKNGKDTKMLDIQHHVGMNSVEICESLKNIENLEYAKESNGHFLIKKGIYDVITKDKLDGFEEEFKEFWHLPKDFKHNVWPGPKNEALKKFAKARSQYSFEFIMDQRRWYLELLKIQSWRQMMIATKFLNVESGQIAEDFQSLVKSLKPQELEIKKETITVEQKNNLFQ